MDAQKGLIVNSRHLCRKPNRNRARSNLAGQNGRRSNTRPVVWATKCLERAKRRRRRARMRARGMALSRASAVGRAGL